jgi:hypothetical protein
MLPPHLRAFLENELKKLTSGKMNSQEHIGKHLPTEVQEIIDGAKEALEKDKADTESIKIIPENIKKEN